MKASKSKSRQAWEQFKQQAGLVGFDSIWEETSDHAWIQLLDEEWESVIHQQGCARGVVVDGFRIAFDHQGYVTIFSKRPKASVTSIGRRCYSPYNPYANKGLQRSLTIALAQKGIDVLAAPKQLYQGEFEVRPIMFEDGQSVVDFCQRNKRQLSNTGIQHSPHRDVEVDFWLSRLGRFTYGAFKERSLVGFCGAMTGGSAAPLPQDVALYYLTDEQFEGKGVASALALTTFAAAKTLLPGVENAVLQIKGENVASQRVAMRIGLFKDDTKSYSGRFGSGEITHLQGYSRRIDDLMEISKRLEK